MRIQKITFQIGRDFSAIMECEFCGKTQKNGSGYDDDFYHDQVIPNMHCIRCGKRSKDCEVQQCN